MRASRSGSGMKLLAVFVVLAICAVIVGGCGMSGYNKAKRLNIEVQSKWAQVENQLQRRYDLVPNLVETVKGYASHEKEIFENIAQARTKYFSANNSGTRAEQVEAANGLERALSRLLVLRETYPELKASQQFNNLMVQLEGTENRIAVERMRYNEAVRDLNYYVDSLLGSMFSRWAGVDKASFFEAPEEARTAPKVDFG